MSLADLDAPGPEASVVEPRTPTDPAGSDPASPTGPRAGLEPSAGLDPWAWLEPLLLAGLAVVAALAFTRILPRRDLTWRVVVAAAVATALVLVCRRTRARSLLVSAGASLVGYAVVAGVLLFRSDTLGGLPTPSSLHALIDGLANGSARILTSAVPTPPIPSALLIPVTVAWLVAWAGNELAGRVRTPLLPALPALAGFVFGLLFGGQASVIGLTAALVALSVGVGVLRAVPPGASSRARLRRLVGGGLPLVLGLAVVAGLVGTGLGTPSDQFDLHDHHPATQTFTPAITPLSQIQGQLLTQPPVDEFRVTVPKGSVDLLPNWRVAVLDQFDGSTWSSPETYVPAGGHLPASEGTSAPTTAVSEEVTIDHLGGVWLPVAGQAQSTSLDLVDVGLQSGSLALANGVGPGLRYRVQASVAQFPADVMAGATPQGGGLDVALPDTDPAGLAVLRHYARDITHKGATPTAKLGLLESYLRTDHFTATPQSASGQSYARLADFMDKHRQGTSEQFAAAFVLMARTLGYPARVAEGFRRGASASGTFTVTSLDAYAWPEVHFAGLGWVPFDPTPDPTGAAAPGAAAAPVTTPGPADQQATQLEPQGSAAAPAPTTAPAGSRHGSLVLVGLLGLVLVALVAAAATVTGLKRRRRRHRRQAPEPGDRVLGAWLEATDQVRTAGVGLPASLTASEVVSTAWVHLGPEVATALGSLRDLANQTRFGAWPATAAQADQAWADADTVTLRVRQQQDRWSRLRAELDPRPLRAD